MTAWQCDRLYHYVHANGTFEISLFWRGFPWWRFHRWFHRTSPRFLHRSHRLRQIIDCCYLSVFMKLEKKNIYKIWTKTPKLFDKFFDKFICNQQLLLLLFCLRWLIANRQKKFYHSSEHNLLYFTSFVKANGLKTTGLIKLTSTILSHTR